jgi:hypothetical protein
MWWHMPIIPAIQEAEIKRIPVQGQPEQKVSKTSSQQKNPEQRGTSVIPAMWDAYVKGSQSEITLGKKENPI